MDHQIDVEEQRMRMQDVLRNAHQALLIAIDSDGVVITTYVNCTGIEVLGLARAMNDHAPRLVRNSCVDGD